MNTQNTSRVMAREFAQELSVAGGKCKYQNGTSIYTDPCCTGATGHWDINDD